MIDLYYIVYCTHIILCIFQDLFPGIDCPEASYDELSIAIKYVLEEDGYIYVSDQVNIYTFAFVILCVLFLIIINI